MCSIAKSMAFEPTFSASCCVSCKSHTPGGSLTYLIDLVRPLSIFISREVPDYSRKTNALSSMGVPGATRAYLTRGTL